MSNTKEHKMSHVLRAIADGIPIQYKPVGYFDEWEDLDVSGHFSIMKGWAYRIKPKPMVKKYYVVYKTSAGEYNITGGRYKGLIEYNTMHPHSLGLYLIKESMIEVEED